MRLAPKALVSRPTIRFGVEWGNSKPWEMSPFIRDYEKIERQAVARAISHAILWYVEEGGDPDDPKEDPLLTQLHSNLTSSGYGYRFEQAAAAILQEPWGDVYRDSEIDDE